MTDTQDAPPVLPRYDITGAREGFAIWDTYTWKCVGTGYKTRALAQAAATQLEQKGETG